MGNIFLMKKLTKIIDIDKKYLKWIYIGIKLLSAWINIYNSIFEFSNIIFHLDQEGLQDVANKVLEFMKGSENYQSPENQESDHENVDSDSNVQTNLDEELFVQDEESETIEQRLFRELTNVGNEDNSESNSDPRDTITIDNQTYTRARYTDQERYLNETIELRNRIRRGNSPSNQTNTINPQFLENQNTPVPYNPYNTNNINNPYHPQNPNIPINQINPANTHFIGPIRTNRTLLRDRYKNVPQIPTYPHPLYYRIGIDVRRTNLERTIDTARSIARKVENLDAGRIGDRTLNANEIEILRKIFEERNQEGLFIIDPITDKIDIRQTLEKHSLTTIFVVRKYIADKMLERK
jgi:hypothetical protein